MQMNEYIKRASLVGCLIIKKNKSTFPLYKLKSTNFLILMMSSTTKKNKDFKEGGGGYENQT